MSSIIKVENLGKKYRISHQQPERYLAMRDVIAEKITKIFKHGVKSNTKAWASEEDFWALSEINFDVSEGDVLGIIGRNGAGKSTLLKILSRITEPTTGKITIRGRVASLLEVGTGFHPELTGRENIYLNGAILGMTSAEIKKKFDEIVDFAEIEKFLDTPVKRYSSGMYVRLAFAVAAHLEPEILVIDEVLAVGDADFQKKCMGRMSTVANEGRTVIFVSHNMAAVSAMCNRAIVLNRGKIIHNGTAIDGVASYLTSIPRSPGNSSFWKYIANSNELAIKNIKILRNNKEAATIMSGDKVTFDLEYELINQSLIGVNISFSIVLFLNEQKVTNFWTDCQNQQITLGRSGHVKCTLNKWPFRRGEIRVELYIHHRNSILLWIDNAHVFNSEDGDFFHSGVITGSNQGILFQDHNWSSDIS